MNQADRLLRRQALDPDQVGQHRQGHPPQAGGAMDIGAVPLRLQIRQRSYRTRQIAPLVGDVEVAHRAAHHA